MCQCKRVQHAIDDSLISEQYCTCTVVSDAAAAAAAADDDDDDDDDELYSVTRISYDRVW